MAATTKADQDQRQQTPRRMALVANANAGALLGQDGGGGSLEELLRRTAASLEVIGAEAGSLPERMRLAIESGADCVVVAGGDGSIACAAAALAGSETALGVIPCGTMNLLAKDIGLDPADHAGAIRNLAHGEVRTIDVGCAAGADGAPHLFLCASMLGAPARLTRHREAGRRGGGGWLAWAGFGRAVLRALLANRSRRLVLRCNGQVLRRRTPSLTITVNRLADGAGRLFGRDCLDDGKLVLHIVPRASALRQAWLLLRTAISGTLHAPEIEVIETDTLEIASRRAGLHVLVDGELRLLAPPLRYTVRPGGLRVVAPPRGSELAPPRGSESAPPRGSESAPPRGDELAPPRGSELAPPPG